MTQLTLLDAASRSGPVAKKKWVKGAPPESHKDVFTTKDKAESKSPRESAQDRPRSMKRTLTYKSMEKK